MFKIMLCLFEHRGMSEDATQARRVEEEEEEGEPAMRWCEMAFLPA